MKKINFLLKKIAFCCLFAASFTAYANEPDGVFILNQGSFGMSNASLGFYDFGTATLQSDIANGELGDTGQDLLIYNSKLFVTLNGSSNITVFDAESHAFLQRIPLFDGSNPREPRYMAAQDGKIYVSCYDRMNGGSVLRINATSYEIEARAQVGEYPEGLAVSGGKLYVANSGGQSATYGNSVSVIDLATFTETERITVGVNPYIIKTDGEGNLFLTYQGNWVDVPGGFQRINTADNSVTELGTSPRQDFELQGGFIYFYDVDYSLSWTGDKRYGKYDIANNRFSELLNASQIDETPYGIGVNPKNGDIYIADSDFFNPGTVTIFNANGELQNRLNNVGINPCKFAFYFGNGGSGIDDTEMNAERVAVAYYSILGVKLNQEPEKGLYIILYDNGTTEKRMR